MAKEIKISLIAFSIFITTHLFSSIGFVESFFVSAAAAIFVIPLAIISELFLMWIISVLSIIVLICTFGSYNLEPEDLFNKINNKIDFDLLIILVILAEWFVIINNLPNAPKNYTKERQSNQTSVTNYPVVTTPAPQPNQYNSYKQPALVDSYTFIASTNNADYYFKDGEENYQSNGNIYLYGGNIKEQRKNFQTRQLKLYIEITHDCYSGNGILYEYDIYDKYLGTERIRWVNGGDNIESFIGVFLCNKYKKVKLINHQAVVSITLPTMLTG